MSSTSIWLPLYIGDMLAMTTRLTTEQIGGLQLLMMDFWQKGDVPNDNKIISAITRLTIAKVKLFKKAIIDSGIFCLSDDGNSLISNYLLSKKSEAEHNKTAKQERAQKAAQARWSKSGQSQTNQDVSTNTPAQTSNAQAYDKNATSNAQAMLEQCPLSLPSSNNINTHTTQAGNFASTTTANQPTFDQDPTVNQKAGELRQLSSTSISDWIPPSLQEMHSTLMIAGVVNYQTLTQQMYDTAVGDFKAYYANQALIGKGVLSTDDIRASKLRQWLQNDLLKQKTSKGKSSSGTAKSSHRENLRDPAKQAPWANFYGNSQPFTSPEPILVGEQ